jgi:hypothetical protein
MADSEAAMIMAKVHECKRKAHDLRDEAHTLTARAAIKAVHLLAARCKICSLRRAAGERGQWPAVGIDRALGQPRRAAGQRILSAPASCETVRVRGLYWPPAVVRRSLVFLRGQPANEIKTFSVELPASQAVQ